MKDKSNGELEEVTLTFIHYREQNQLCLQTKKVRFEQALVWAQLDDGKRIWIPVFLLLK